MDKSRRELHKALIDQVVVPSCINCGHWSANDAEPPPEGTRNWCTKFNQYPPETIIVLSCDSWMMDIPF